MQPAKGHRKRIVSALVLVVAVAVTASSAIGRSRHANAAAASPRPSACTAGHCMLSLKTSASSISVEPTEVPANKHPSFTAPTDNPAQGMLNGKPMTHVLDCGSYRPADNTAYQFFLGGTFRGHVFYKVTYTVNNVKDFGGLQYCLGATFHFNTRTGQAQSATLPNGLRGFSGLVPRCGPAKPPCLVSKTRNGRGATLKLLIPAVEGADPWGRS